MKKQIGTVVSGRISGHHATFALLCASTIRLKKVRIESAGGLQQIRGRHKKAIIVIDGFNPAIGGGGTVYRLPKKKKSP